MESLNPGTTAKGWLFCEQFWFSCYLQGLIFESCSIATKVRYYALPIFKSDKDFDAHTLAGWPELPIIDLSLFNSSFCLRALFEVPFLINSTERTCFISTWTDGWWSIFYLRFSIKCCKLINRAGQVHKFVICKFQLGQFEQSVRRLVLHHCQVEPFVTFNNRVTKSEGEWLSISGLVTWNSQQSQLSFDIAI